MYTVSVRRGDKFEHSTQFPNLRDALRQLDGFAYAFPELVSELWSGDGVLWRCNAPQARAGAEPPDSA